MTFFPGTVYDPTTGAVSGASAAAARPHVATADATLDAATGELVAVLGPPPSGMAWSIRRITVSADNPCQAYVYIGSRDRAGLVNGTRTGQMDEDDANQPIFVDQGLVLIVAWQTGEGTAGARIEYDELA